MDIPDMTHILDAWNSPAVEEEDFVAENSATNKALGGSTSAHSTTVQKEPTGALGDSKRSKSEDNEDVFLSLDLEEATYNMPFSLLRENLKFIDWMLSDCKVWKVYHKLFKVLPRCVDMTALVENKTWTGPNTVTSTSGSFMGDVMSFIHLSLYMRGTLSVAYPKGYKPISQSVGDDLVALKLKLKFATKFNSQVKKTGGKVSKINSISRDSLTFCEQYAVIPNDPENYPGYDKGSVFGDLFYLDVIKGSILTGKSKVSATGSNPFLGHSRMLNLQTSYHPLGWVKQRAKRLLWLRNFHSARKLGGALASLPVELGGVGLAIGPIVEFDDKEFQEDYLPYFKSLVRERDDKVFFAFYSLLQGIFKANPKGCPYENKPDRLFMILDQLKLTRVRDRNDLLPVEMANAPNFVKMNYISDRLGLRGIQWLVDEIARREAYYNFWHQTNSNVFMTLPLREPISRFRSTWKEIRRNFSPKKDNPSATPIKRMKDVVQMIKDRCWNVYFRKDDPAIAEALGGCPTMFMDWVM